VQGKYRFRSVLYPRKIGRVRAAALILAALAVGLLLSACGGGGNGKLVPGTTADQITTNLDQAQASFYSGDCEKAEIAVAQVSTEVDDLNKKVDVELKKALKNGALKLSEVVNNCGAAEEAEEAKAEEKAEEEEQAQIEGEEAEAEEEAFLEEQNEEERDQKAEEKAEKEAEKAEPPTGGEESPKGEAKGLEKQEEETVPPPTEEFEEVTPPAAGGGPAGGVGPGAAVEGGE
jgi:membrane protein involved in colicin uptake